MLERLSRRRFLQATTIAGVGLASGRAFSAPRFNARIAHVYAAGHPIEVHATQFANKVMERSGGDIALKLFPNSQLGDEVQTAEGMRLGSIDGAYFTSPILTGYIPELQVVDLPFLLRDDQHALKVATSKPIFDKLAGYFPGQGFRLVSIIPNGGRYPFGKFPIVTPNDVKGRKIRVIQAPLPVALWKLLGSNPTPLPGPELYSALQTGLVDFAENTKINYRDFRFFEVAPYFAELSHQYSFQVLVFSRDWWNKLTPDHQAMMQEVAASIMPDVAKLVFEGGNQAVADTVSKGGVKVGNISDHKPWQELARPLWSEYAQKVPTLRPLISDIEGA